MKTGKEIVEKYCKHQGYGNYTIDEYGLIKAIDDAIKQAKRRNKRNNYNIDRLERSLNF